MASALPTHPKVYTFDIPSSMERANAFRSKTENEWQAAVKALQIDITFHNLDLLTVSDVDFRRYMNTWLIMLDTFHEPYQLLTGFWIYFLDTSTHLHLFRAHYLT